MSAAPKLSSNTFFLTSSIETKTVSSSETEFLLNSSVRRLDILEALKRLETISILQKDWDSYGGEAPAAAAISTAQKFIGDLNRMQKPAPFFVAPISDGGIQMEWLGLGGALEVEIAPIGGSFNYLRIVGKGTADRKSEERHGVSVYHILEQIDSVIRE